MMEGEWELILAPATRKLQVRPTEQNKCPIWISLFSFLCHTVIVPRIYCCLIKGGGEGDIAEILPVFQRMHYAEYTHENIDSNDNDKYCIFFKR